MSDEQIPKGTDDLGDTLYGKTWHLIDDDAISDALSDVLKAALEEDAQPKVQGVLFYIANQSQPIIIADEDVIRIGRKDAANNAYPTLDLSDYFGKELGVSRYHAEIIHNNGSYYIKDMGSTNGTWLNTTKIHPYSQTPIHDSDQVRLGHLTMLVKFNTG